MITEKDLITLIRQAGIGYTPMPYFQKKGAHARLGLNDTLGYEIQTFESYHKMSERERLAILAHELAHFLRQDLIVLLRDKLDRSIWNYATDAAINEAMIADLPGDIITYQKVRAAVPGHAWPVLVPDARYTYHVLSEHVERQPDAGDTAAGGDGNGDQGEQGDQDGDSDGDGGDGAADRLRSHDEIEADGDVGRAMIRHAETVERWRRALEGAPREVREALREALRMDPRGRSIADRDAGTGMMGDTAAIDPVYIDCAAILRAVDRAARRAPAVYGDQRVRTRTWRRSRNGLPLRLDLPTLRVVLAVDVSGSMSAYYPYLVYLERALERRYQVELWHWSDGAKRMPPRSAVRDWGGGTDIRSLLSGIGRPAVLVVVTDGYIAPSPRDLTFPACPIVWAVIHPGDVNTAPYGADVISMHPPREGAKKR
jgi:hypothetical protein